MSDVEKVLKCVVPFPRDHVGLAVSVLRRRRERSVG